MKSAKSDQRNMIQNKLTNTSHIATNGCQWLGKETERETNSCQFHQAITRMMEDGKQRTTETDQYLSAVDEYVLEEYENIWEKFEMLAQINIKDSTVTRHRKRIKQLIRNDLSMATKLNEIDNQLRTCCRIMTKASACKENEALTHSNCEAERSHIMIFGDSMANISECLKQFETTVNSWLQNVKKRVFSLQKERNQLQVALKSAGIGFPTRTATVFQRATGGAVLRSCFTKHPEMKRKHDRLCEIELQIEKYTSISDKCKQLSQQCKEFTLQSPSYTEAMVKAHIPFTHHYILECDYNGLKYTLEDHDITLIIPEGAVAMDQVIHIEIDATMYGPFVFPENAQPISPIIWLCQKEKDAKLKKSFQLIVPHFLTGLTTEKLQYHQVGFAKAIHSTSKGKDGEMKYKFNRCDSEPHFAMCGNKSYAVLESDHCCFYCLQAKKTPEIARDAGYCLTQIENSLSEKQHEVYFIATYFLDTCFQAVQEQFPTEKGYKTVCRNFFKFKNRKKLHIKLTHDQHTDQEYIVAWEPSIAQIEALDIDFSSRSLERLKLEHKMRMYPPYVKMTVTMTTTDPFKFSVGVTGCQNEAKLKRDITFPLVAVARSTPSESQPQCLSHTIIITGETPELRDALRKLLPLAERWNNIGVFLGINDGTLTTIKHNERQADDCLREMLSVWLRSVSPPPTWSNLADAIEPYDPARAKEIRGLVSVAI